MQASGSIVLDTSVVVQHLRGTRDATQLVARFESVYVPLIVLGELLVGIRRSERSAENLATLQRWLQSLTLIGLTQETAHQYAEIKNQLRVAGKPIPENDIWIAAHARE